MNKILRIKNSLGVESQVPESSCLHVIFCKLVISKSGLTAILLQATTLELGILFIFKFLWTSLAKRVFWFPTAQVCMDHMYTLYKGEMLVKLKQTNIHWEQDTCNAGKLTEPIPFFLSGWTWGWGNKESDDSLVSIAFHFFGKGNRDQGRIKLYFLSIRQLVTFIDATLPRFLVS